MRAIETPAHVESVDATSAAPSTRVTAEVSGKGRADHPSPERVNALPSHSSAMAPLSARTLRGSGHGASKAPPGATLLLGVDGGLSVEAASTSGYGSQKSP